MNARWEGKKCESSDDECEKKGNDQNIETSIDALIGKRFKVLNLKLPLPCVFTEISGLAEYAKSTFMKDKIRSTFAIKWLLGQILRGDRQRNQISIAAHGKVVREVQETKRHRRPRSFEIYLLVRDISCAVPGTVEDMLKCPKRCSKFLPLLAMHIRYNVGAWQQRRLVRWYLDSFKPGVGLKSITIDRWTTKAFWGDRLH
ncbi:hypothetical protein TNCV_222931 [Trichonephila clavipes]|nr:hypothetical protein TNCV_222931 [Trichonephila clavipes]